MRELPVKYKWLLFDADGTLFDYDKAEGKALQRTLEAFGIEFEPSHAETYRRLNSGIWRQFEQGVISQERLRTRRFELLFEALQVDCDPEAFSSRYLRNLAAGSELIDGAEEVVRALHAQVGLLIITNGLADVQRPRFARSTIGDCFADIVISEEVGAAKPHKKIFDIAFEKMDSPRKKDVLIIGDSLSSDIQGGNNYGIDSCWFNARRRPRDGDVEIQHEIKDLRELLDLVGLA
jgi:YjjG family noncanonical pyrimidine nucleotidase